MRSQPGKFAYSSAGVGSAPHLAMELFARSEGLQMLHVPYNGSGPAMNDLVANTVQVSMDNVAAIPLIRAGRLRALAISGERRSEGFPNLPTFAEAGAANFNVLGVWGFLGPAAMTDAAATAIGDGIMAALRDKAIADTLTAQGITPEYGPANQFSQILRDEAERWSKLIEQAKIKL